MSTSTHHCIGRTAEGLRVVVDIKIESHGSEGMTREAVDHSLVTGPFDTVSFQAGLVNRSGRDYDECGQATHLLREVTEFAPGWDQEAVDVLDNLWARYHLNQMNGACVHMPEYAKLITEPGSWGGQQVSTKRNICPVTGYRYGHAWLVELLPDEVVDAVKRLQRRPAESSKSGRFSLPGWV